jgi:chorismate mutase
VDNSVRNRDMPRTLSLSCCAPTPVLETGFSQAQDGKASLAYDGDPARSGIPTEELRMSTSTGPPETSAGEEDQAIRERVRGLMSQILQQGQIDPEGVKEVMRAVTGGALSGTAPTAGASGTEFTDAVRRLDAALVVSAEAAHRALETVAIRGTDLTDNDIKGALASLMKLQEDCLAAVNVVSGRASGDNLRRELDQLAVHAQNVGVEASAGAGALMNEFASRIAGSYRETTVPSLEAARAFSARMALLTSGIIAGVADALSDQSGSKKAK